MNFEYDPEKSAVNLIKHGIDFKTAQALWDDQNVLEIPAKTTDEPRFLTIRKIDGKYWSAITTYRDKNTRIILFMFKNTPFRVFYSWCMARRKDASIVILLKDLATTPCAMREML